MKKQLGALLLTAALILAAGCTPRGETPPGGGEPSSTESTYQPPLTPIEMEHDDVWWWENYIRDSIYQMQGGMGNDRLSDQSIMLDIAISHAAMDERTVEPAGDEQREHTDNTYVTKDVLDEYVNRYFGLENTDSFFLANLSDDAGNIGTYAQGWMHHQRGTDPEDPPNGDWAFLVTDVQKADDSHVLITVDTIDEDYPEGWSRRNRFLMAHAGSDQYRYENVTVEYALSSAGETTQFTGIEAQTSNFAAISPLDSQGMIGSIEDVLYMSTYHYELGVLSFSAVHAKTLEQAYPPLLFALQRGEERCATAVGTDAIRVVTTQRLLEFSPDLTEMKETPLPEPVAGAGSLRRLTLSPDGTWYGYVDDEGAKLYRVDSGEVVFVAKHPHYSPNAEGREMMSNITYGTPSWTNDGTYAIFTLYGYESVEGVLVYNLSTGEKRELSQGYAWSSGFVGPVQGKLIATATNLGPAGDNQMLDLQTGEIELFRCTEEQGNWEYLVMGDELYLLQALPIPGIDDWETRFSTLFRVDVEAGTITPTGFTANGSTLSLRGATKEYAVFSYSRLSSIGDQGFVSVPLH